MTGRNAYYSLDTNDKQTKESECQTAMILKKKKTVTDLNISNAQI